jgi:putative ABC transport system substrate-binding protein
MTGKLTELALEFVPTALRIGLLLNPTAPSTPGDARETAEAASARHIVVLTEEVTTLDGLAPAFDRLKERQAQAVIVTLNSLFHNESAHIASLALSARLPTIFGERRAVEIDGLASYGINLEANFRRAADYVDRILKGSKPADMPIEFPTKFELAVNMKTAKAIGLDVPATLLARADEVIE